MFRLYSAGPAVAVIVLGGMLSMPFGPEREREARVAEISVHTGREGCTVELDSTPAGKSDAQGSFVLREVEPTDHYVHILCPNEGETGYLVSPRAGEKLEIRREVGGPPAAATPSSPLEAAQTKVRLRKLVQDAVRLRARGRLDEAVQHLREARRLDAENSDLHRELGITFLLGKDWKRARVEMLEAIRHNPTDADAYNGLGYALEKIGHLEAALKAYRAATQLEPDDPSYRQHYMEALGKLAAKQHAEKKK